VLAARGDADAVLSPDSDALLAIPADAKARDSCETSQPCRFPEAAQLKLETFAFLVP
jgi:hypothetical protein